MASYAYVGECPIKQKNELQESKNLSRDAEFVRCRDSILITHCHFIQCYSEIEENSNKWRFFVSNLV